MNLDTARFSGTAGTVTLGSGITVGGLWFDTTGYTIANAANTLSFNATTSAITLNNIAAATITGQLGGTGNVTLSATNPGITTGTLTLNGTSTGGWSGSTTINPGMTLALAESNQGLNSTSAITLNGGAITLTNTTANATTNSRINDGAGITSNGGTLTLTNTAGAGLVYAETIGTVGLVRGQTNFVLTNNQTNTGNQTLTIGTGGLTRSGASNSSAVTFSAGGTGPSTTRNMIVVTGANATGVGQIIGPWATVGTAAANQTDYAVYNGSQQVVASNIAANNAEGTWASNSNITLGATATTVTGTRTLNSLRYTAGAGTLALGSAAANLETYGLLNGGSGLLTVSTAGTGGLTTPTGGGNLYVTTGNNAVTVSAPIYDNGGAVTVVKSGSNTLLLTSTASTFSGGIVLNAGTLSSTSDASLGYGGGMTVNGAATWNADNGAGTALTYNRAITINDGAVLSLASGNAGKTITGVLSGNGAIVNTSTTGFNFSNIGNTFTGIVNNGYTTNFASLGDSSNPINLINSNSVFDWTGGAKTFALRPFTIQATGTGVIQNSGTGALTIQQNLGITGTAGARTLTLQGANNSQNIFAGNITDGAGSAVTLNKAGGGRWALSGTNTYSGNTTNSVNNPAGSFYFLGMQAVSPNTSIVETQGGGTGGNVAWNFLDGSATPLSRSTTNLVHNQSNGSQNVMSVFVGNDSIANGGTSNSTQTGSVIQLGNMTFNQTAIGATAGAGLTVNGANGYQLRIGNVNIGLQSSQNGTWNVALTGNNPLQVTGNVAQAAGSSNATVTLQLGGTSTGSWISGNITNSSDGRQMLLTKSGTGTWTLNGTNTYNGTTIISAGSLLFNGNSSAATGAVTVSGGSLGGVGSLGGAVTANSTGGIDLRDGVTGNLTLGSTLSITGAAGANNLYFDLASGGSATDRISAAGAFSMTNNGSGVVNINQVGGTANRLVAGTYDILTAASGISAGSFRLSTSRAFGQTFALGGNATALQLTTTQVTSTVGNTTFSGSNASWNVGANFTGGSVPDYGSNVTINSNIGTGSPLSASQNINSLTYGSSATANTTIIPGAAASGVAYNMLVIEAGTANGNPSGNGITVSTPSSGTTTQTISANIGITQSQTWTIGSNATFVASGVVSDFGGGYGLTKAGGGTLTISVAPTYTGATTITGGTFNVSSIVGGGSAITPLATSSIAFTTADSTFLAAASGTGTVTYPTMSIANGVTVTFDRGGGGNNTPFAIPSLTGGGTFRATNSGGAGTSVTFSSLGSFTGNLDLFNANGNAFNTPDLNDAASSKVRMSSSLNSQTPSFNYTGAGNLALSNRQFELYGTTANTVFAINNNGSGTFTITPDLLVSATGSKTLTLGGTSADYGNTFAGVIGNGNGTIALTKAGAGYWTLTNNNTYTGATTISTGVLQLGNGGATGSLSGTSGIVNNANLTINRSNAFTQASDLNGRIISGTGSFTQAGTGNTTLSFANTFSGATSIAAGKLILGHNQALQNSALTLNFADQLVLSGIATPTIGGLNGGATINLSSVSGYSSVTTLTLNPQSGVAATFNGAVPNGSGAMSLVKSGAGTQNLSGPLTYTGTTTISAGTLNLNQSVSAATIPTITLSANGATLGSSGAPVTGPAGVLGNIISSAIEIGSSVTNTGVTVQSSGTSRVVYAGNITGSATSGNFQTLNIATSFDRASTLFSGVISNGTNGGGLNVSVALNLQTASSSANDHPANVSLSGINTFTGNLTATRAQTGATSWLTIGGERWTDGGFGVNVPAYGRMGSGFLGGSNGGNYTGAINLSSVASSIVVLDYFSSANQTWSGVIGGGANNLGALVKEGSGTLTLTNQNLYSSLTTVGGGKLLLAFNNTNNNILPSTTPLWMGLGTTYAPNTANKATTISGGGGGGTLELGGTNGTSNNQTVASLTTAANTTSSIVVGANRTLFITSGAIQAGASHATVGAATISTGGVFGLNFNTSAGGVVQFSGNVTGLTNGFTVTDATGFGLATTNGSNQIIRDTGTAALVASGGSSATNYLTTTSSGNSVTASQSVGSITTDTSGGNVTLTLNGGVTLSNNLWNFGGLGTNTATVTGGAGVSAVTSNATILINNFNAGTVTFNTPITANGTNALVVGGTGTVALNGVNTFNGSMTINSGNLQVGGSGSLRSGNFTSTIGINGGSVLQYSSSAAQTLSGAISGPGGITKDTSNSDLTLSSASNIYTGTTTVSAGRIITTVAGNLNNGGTSLVQSGTGQFYLNGAVNFANPVSLSTLGYTESGDSQNNQMAIRLSGGTLSNAVTLTGNSRIGSIGGNQTGTVSGQITGGFGIDFYGVAQGSNNDQAFIVSSTANNYTGSTTIINSLLNSTAFTNTSTTLKLGASNVIPDGASAGNVVFAVNVVGGTLPSSTVVFDLNGNNETINGLTVNSGTFATRITNSASPASTLTIGANDTTSSFDGTITSSSGTLALTKIGNGTLTVTGNNSYTGGTSLAGGTLSFANGSLGSTGNITFTGGSSLQWNGSNTQDVSSRIVMTNGVVSSFDTNGNTVTFASAIGGATTGALTKVGTGTLILNGSNTYSGATNVNEGTLRVNGSLAAGSAVTVAAGATLGGSGTINGVTTIAGLHSPGNSPGIQTFASDLTYSGGNSSVTWELWDNTTTNAPNPNAVYDQIIVGGNLDFAGATTLNLALIGGNSTVDWDNVFWSTNQTWTLYDVAGSTSNFSNFTLNVADWQDASGQALSSSVRNGSTFNVSQVGSDILINYIAVPEPAAIALATCGLVGLGLAAGRRFRRG